MKKLSVEKLDNHIYSKIKFNLSIEASHEGNDSTSSSSCRTTKQKLNQLIISEEIAKNKKLSYMKPIDKNCLHKSSSSINCSIQASTPYIELNDELKKASALNRKKWVAKENFNACFDKATISKNTSIDLLNLGPNHNCFELRKVNKDKWITKKNFFV